jgi:hypothetical protein
MGGASHEGRVVPRPLRGGASYGKPTLELIISLGTPSMMPEPNYSLQMWIFPIGVPVLELYASKMLSAVDVPIGSRN